LTAVLHQVGGSSATRVDAIDRAAFSPRARNAGIDVLRGLSIVLVVLHHIGLRIPLRQSVLRAFVPDWLLRALIYNGYEAVFVFFVISGFLITSNCLARWGSLAAIDARAFYRRRAARILPCLLLLVAVLSAFDLGGVTHYAIDNAKQTLPRAIVAALGLHLNWYEGMTGYLPASWDVLWSLSIEELFYLAFPLVCLTLGRTAGRTRWLVPGLLVFALSLPFTRAALEANEVWQEKAYLPGMAAIAMGMLAAIVAARWTSMRGSTMLWLRALGVVGLVAVFCFESLLWPLLGNGCVLLETFSAACLVVSLQLGAKASTTSPTRWLAWLRSFGRLSYEVYLCHMFAVWIVVDVYRATGAGQPWGFVWYFPAAALSWALGWLLARFFSIPVERIIVGSSSRRIA
jgi:peptidoglycan/LPS O-acetylase OafA/YrhL